MMQHVFCSTPSWMLLCHIDSSIYWWLMFNLCTGFIALSSCHLTTTSLSFIRWSTRIMSSDWNCRGWLNNETLRSVSMVTWYSAARMWKPLSQSPSTRRLPSWHCPSGTQRGRAPYLLTSAPRNPAACCCSATAACRAHSQTGSPGLTSSPSSYWMDSSTWSWIWALAASRWKPATRDWMTASGAMSTSRGKGATVRELRVFVRTRKASSCLPLILCSSSFGCKRRLKIAHAHVLAFCSLQWNMHAH